MRHSLHREYRTHHPHENYTLGGLLIYAAVVPALVALLAAPALLLTLALGFAIARGVSRLHSREPEATDEGTRYRVAERAAFDSKQP